MKRFLRFLLRFILKLIPALVCTAGVIVYLSLHYSVLSEGPGQDIGFEYVDKEIYVNGAHIYNFQLMHPVVQGVELNSVDPEKIAQASGAKRASGIRKRYRPTGISPT